MSLPHRVLTITCFALPLAAILTLAHTRLIAQKAFSCAADAPMVRQNACRVW